MKKRDIYHHRETETRWRKIWEEKKIFAPDLRNSKNKFYNLWMFPYPSAEGLHAGHAFASTGSDVYGKYLRMNGKNLFQPIGYDSFGIHSENFALKIKKHPIQVINKTTKTYENQLRLLGHSYDWSKTVTTSDIDYYRWTQWLFVEMFKAGLAYRKKSEVNWCPSCKTVLADEQVVTPQQAGKDPKNGKGKIVNVSEGMQVCERCGTIIERKELEQWFFRITKYADKLLGGLEKIKWPEKIKTAQRNWIGRKEWIDIKYPIEGRDEEIVVSTTRPDTNFGATFIVVSCEHPFVEKIVKGELKVGKSIKESITKYVKVSKSKSDTERISGGREKTGIFTGMYAINQLNEYKMPIYVTDFVLMSVGTGMVVGVPGHDKRDFEFAQKFNLPVIRVVVGSDGDKSDITKIEQVQEEEGIMVNSSFLNGLDIHTATKNIMDYLEKKGWGKRVIRYHLRDWLISRQRYWGPPIPMIFCKGCAKEGKSWLNSDKAKKWLNESSKSVFRNKIIGNWELGIGRSADWSAAGWYPVSEKELPVELPIISDYKPKGKGKGPLANHPEFYKVKCPECGGDAERETDVSDTFLDSAWYFLRYPSVNSGNSNQQIDKLNDFQENGKYLAAENSAQAGKMENLPWDPKITKDWLPVDLYFGGAEHSVLHLMYSRFTTMVLHDLGYISFAEPFPWFFAHGLMIKDGAKMSKSRGNVVNPDEYIEKYGADTLRLYLMFMGPMDGYPDFRDEGIEGMRKFTEKVWQLFDDNRKILRQTQDDKTDGLNVSADLTNEISNKLLIKMHQTIKKVTEDIEKFHYNTAISAIMVYVSVLKKQLSIFNDKLTIKSEVKNKKEKEPRYQIPDTIYLKNLALLLAPFTPHLAEEVWIEVLGQKFSIHTAKWPQYDSKYIKEDQVEIAIQVNGRLRATLRLRSEQASDKKKVIEAAKENEKVIKWIEGKEIKNEIFVPGKLVNFVI